MTEQEMLARMVAPGTKRAGKYRLGVIQIHVTRACDKSCYACTQGSNLGGKVEFMSPELFEQAVRSLGFVGSHLDGPDVMYEHGDSAYFGVVGVFGGNPALSPHFEDYCATLRKLVPFNQRGLWCNNPVTVEKARAMACTFDPSVSNLNVHLDAEAYGKFREGWPGARPVGLTEDSRHSPVHLAMKDVLRVKCPTCNGTGVEPETAYPEGPGDEYDRCSRCDGSGEVPDDDRIRELVSGCDINQHWSAMLGVFRGGLRAWFCEVAGAQAMLHQHDPSYPDTGVKLYPDGSYELREDAQYITHGLKGSLQWWQLNMPHFALQVRKHCWECGVPLRGYGQLSQAPAGFEQTSVTHEAVFRPKRPDRRVEVVSNLVQLEVGKIRKVNQYIQNGRLP